MSSGLTPAQMKNLALAWHCMESEPKIDFERFTTLAGLKNAATARETLRQAKKKLLETNPIDGSEGAVAPTPAKATTKAAKAPKKTPGSAKGKGKKATVKKEQSEDDEDAADFTPSKEADKKKKRVRDGAVKVEAADDDEDAAGQTDEEYERGMNKKAKIDDAAAGAEMSVEAYQSMQREFDD